MISLWAIVSLIGSTVIGLGAAYGLGFRAGVNSERLRYLEVVAKKGAEYEEARSVIASGSLSDHVGVLWGGPSSPPDPGPSDTEGSEA